MSSGHDVNVKKFKQYALETAKLFVDTYPWYPMLITVHKILIHGPQIIESDLLPVGQLFEDAQETRNKDKKISRRLLEKMLQDEDYGRCFQLVNSIFRSLYFEF